MTNTLLCSILISSRRKAITGRNSLSKTMCKARFAVLKLKSYLNMNLPVQKFDSTRLITSYILAKVSMRLTWLLKPYWLYNILTILCTIKLYPLNGNETQFSWEKKTIIKARFLFKTQLFHHRILRLIDSTQFQCWLAPKWRGNAAPKVF